MNDRFDRLVFALLLASLSVNVYLARRDHHAAPIEKVLRVGDKVPTLKGSSLAGEPALVSFAHRPVVLYVFSPRCPWCDRNLLNAKALDESDLVTYLQRNGIDWQVLRGVSAETRQAFRFLVTPQTIVVDVGGTVRHVWTGAYTNDIARQVQREFAITLPGLQASKPGA